MKKDFDQIELNTDGDGAAEIKQGINDLIERVCRTINDIPGQAVICRSKQEAYGIAAENLSLLALCMKRNKDSLGRLLDILPEPNRPGTEAAADIFAAFVATAQNSIVSAAKLKKAMLDMYSVDNGGPGEDGDGFPLAEISAGDFQDADDIGDDPEDN